MLPESNSLKKIYNKKKKSSKYIQKEKMYSRVFERQ